MAILTAAAIYAGLIFALGFGLGVLRVLWIAPALGPVLAVATEVPVMVAASALVAGRVARGRGVPARTGPRLAMGGLAFALLMAAEAILGRIAFGLSPAAFAGTLVTPEGLVGLAGQLAFAAMPLLDLARRPRAAGPDRAPGGRP